MVNQSVPMIGSLSLAIATAGGAAVTLTVNGSGFTASSTVQWGSTSLSTQYLSGTELTAQVPSSAIANAGTVTVTVQNLAPGGGVSNAFQFEVDSAGSNSPPNFPSITATVSPGSSATYPVTLPSSATNVSATCLNLPIGTTCTYSATAGAVVITTSSTTPAGTYQVIVVSTETMPGSATVMTFCPFSCYC
jgi:hypothetical protein